MRCFVACEVNSEIADELRSLQERLPSARMTFPKRFHLTLKFLGDVLEEQLEQVEERLFGLVHNRHIIGQNKQRFCLKDIGVFSPDNVRVVWVGLTPKQPLINLHDAIDEALADLFPKDNRFHPHFTLARVKSLKDRKEFLEELSKLKVRKLCFDIGGFSLFKSELTPQGPEYAVLATFPQSL